MKFVLCLGSFFASDDVFGIIVAEELMRRGLKNVEVCGSDLSPLMSKMEEVETLIIVDAVDWGAKPGEIFVKKLEEIEDFSGLTTHGISPILMVRVLKEVIGKPKEVYLVGVQPAKLELGMEHSEDIRKSVGNVVEIVSNLLRS